jgi:energy-coupling factor transport system substrate-specific component
MSSRLPPYFFVLVLVYGLADAIIVSSLTMVVTGFLMGFSVIILGQMLSYAVILSLGALVFKGVKPLVFRTVVIFILTMFYGFIISIFSAQLFGSLFWPFWLSGLTFDLAHAVSTALFFPILATIFKNILKTGY